MPPAQGQSPDDKVFDLNYCFRLVSCVCLFVVFNQQLSIFWGFVFTEKDISRARCLPLRGALREEGPF